MSCARKSKFAENIIFPNIIIRRRKSTEYSINPVISTRSILGCVYRFNVPQINPFMLQNPQTAFYKNVYAKYDKIQCNPLNLNLSISWDEERTDVKGEDEQRTDGKGGENEDKTYGIVRWLPVWIESFVLLPTSLEVSLKFNTPLFRVICVTHYIGFPFSSASFIELLCRCCAVS